MKQQIGVAGCGNMGLPMAKCLLNHGFDVHGYDVRPIAKFGDFASHMVANPEKFGTSCDIIISVVHDKKQTLDLCFNDQAIFKGNDIPKTFQDLPRMDHVPLDQILLQALKRLQVVVDKA